VTPTAVCTPEEKRAALDRALRSRTFARSEQLRAFLSFVCEAEIQGRGRDVTEYVIGVEVLGRPQNYSPAEDSSVRTRAYELRQKLQKLYALELSNEPVQIAIAKGAYAPQYLKSQQETQDENAVVLGVPGPPVAPQQDNEEHAAGRNNRRRWYTALEFVLLGAAIGAGVTFSIGRQRASRPDVEPGSP
jgi:hypothetical protein